MAFGFDDFVGGVVGTLGDMAESAWNNYLGNKSAKKAAERNYQYSLRYLQNAPSSQVQGLRDAGLNPILAVSGGFSGSSPSQFSGTPPTPSGGGSFIHGISASANRRLVNAQIEAQNSVIDKNKADAALSRAEAEYVRMHKVNSTPSGALVNYGEKFWDKAESLFGDAKRLFFGDEKSPVRLSRPIPEEYFHNVPGNAPRRDDDFIPRDFWNSLERTNDPGIRVQRHKDGSRDYFFERSVERPKKGFRQNIR